MTAEEGQLGPEKQGNLFRITGLLSVRVSLESQLVSWPLDQCLSPILYLPLLGLLWLFLVRKLGPRCFCPSITIRSIRCSLIQSNVTCILKLETESVSPSHQAYVYWLPKYLDVLICHSPVFASSLHGLKSLFQNRAV